MFYQLYPSLIIHFHDLSIFSWFFYLPLSFLLFFLCYFFSFLFIVIILIITANCYV